MQNTNSDNLTKKDRILDFWRSIYCWVIPTLVCIIYVAIYLLTQIKYNKWYTLFESANLNNSLEAIITFISIVITFFGVLLPVLISVKDTSEMIKWFFEVADKEYFINSMKKVFLSGFATIFVSCLLFFYDVFAKWFSFAVSIGLIWMLLYFIASSYRFISILLSLLFKNKDTGYKKVRKQ
jgi:hypothetical protein